MKFDATTQALNYAMQSSAMTMGRINQTFGMRRELPKGGEVRKDLKTRRYVEVVDDEDIPVYVVVDVLSGRRYEVTKVRLGAEANEMEVIAWAASR